jgi:MOSC domain-containing protein YiiM
MTIEAICIARKKGGELILLQSVSVVAGAGIVGDRAFGAKQKYPGQNITLVAAEEIERFNADHGVSIPLTDTRRNLVTRGVRLNDLVGRTFTVGAITLRGVELCEPCSTLGRYLSATGLSPARVVRALTHRAGLRADVVTSGTISIGDSIAETTGYPPQP